ncbi:Hypothetical predicted protein [Paramuricea clavata]|uniref:Uncharacterized protein n=1 Tax=Paramuricea clavata TaxID=317549 RepID=A0A7D9ENK2_PARCT|nr:Hypothetical predicted protein [Paramuricea clavata]
MHISLEAADTKDFNPDPAIHLWQQAMVCGRGQRPSQKIWKKTKAKQTQSRNESGSDTESDAVSEYSKSDQESSNDSSNEDEDHEMELNYTGLDLFNSESSEESDFEGFHI